MSDKNVNYQIRWLDQRNANEDLSSPWKRISIEKVRQKIAQHVGPQQVEDVLRSIRSGTDWSGKEKKFSIRADPSCVAQPVVVASRVLDIAGALRSITNGTINVGDVITITGGGVTVRQGQISGATILPAYVSGSSYASGAITTIEKFKQDLLYKIRCTNPDLDR